MNFTSYSMFLNLDEQEINKLLLDLIKHIFYTTLFGFETNEFLVEVPG